MERARLRRGAPAETGDAFERQALEFHQRVRSEFLAIAASEPERCKVVRAGDAVDVVESAIWSAVESHLEPA